MISSTLPLPSAKVLRLLYEKINTFLGNVLEESGKILEMDMPDYKLRHFLDFTPLIKMGRSLIWFYVISTDGISPGGNTERSSEWIAFGKVSAKILGKMSPTDKRWVAVAIHRLKRLANDPYFPYRHHHFA